MEIRASQRLNYYEVYQTNYKVVKNRDELHLSWMHGVYMSLKTVRF